MKLLNKLTIQTGVLLSVLGGLSLSASVNAQEITGLSGFTIFIDPGHSQTENGGVYGYSEAQKTLRVGLELQRLLTERTDIDSAYISRTNDNQNVTLTQRTDLANSLNVDFFYSIHSDAGGATATSTLTLHGGWQQGGQVVEKTPKGGKAFGDIMIPILTSAMSGSRTIGTRGNYADRTFYLGFVNHTQHYPYLHVNRESNMASLLSEAGFHTNTYQNTRNMNADYKRMEGHAAFWTVLEYLGVERPVEGILAGELTDLDTEKFANGASITVQGITVTTDTYESLFNKYVNVSDLLGNGFFYIDGLTPGPAEVIIGGENFVPDTLQVVIKEKDITFLNTTIVNKELPTIASTTPGEGGKLNPGKDVLSVTFSKNMDKTSVENVLTIEPEVSHTLSWKSGKTLSITTSGMEFESDYTLTIAEGSFDNSPRNLELDGDNDGEPGGVFTLNFSTGPEDITPPKVTAIDPFNTTTLTNETLVNITFNELIDHATVKDSLIHLEATGSPNLYGTSMPYDVGDRTVVSFFPDSVLKYNTKYTMVLEAGYADPTGNKTTAERRAAFTTGNLKQISSVNIHNFEGALTPFWEPSQSGSTAGYISDLTGTEKTNSITNLLTGSTGAMKVNYGFMKDENGLLRIYHESTTPTFNSNYVLQAYVFGDGNGNNFRFVVRDSNNELEGSAWTAVNWIGWKLVTWNLGEDEVVPFATGNGVIDGNVYFDSFQIAYVTGKPNVGYLVFDDLKAVMLSSATANTDETADGTPVALRLNQNYPNPFNPATNIQFELPVQMEVNLELFDMLGRKVATIFNGTSSAGAHTIRFDANDLASGVYIYRLTAGNRVLSRKMLLMK